MIAVGVSSHRKEGPEKLCGVAKYIDDYKLPGCLFGVTLRATIPHGTITNIRFDPDFPWHECVIARAEDIPGENVVKLIEEDQPLLTEGRILHAMEPILIVGHPARDTAYQALGHIAIDYQEKTPVLSLEESIALKGVLYAPDNVFKRILIEKGDIGSGLATADAIVEGEYRVPYQEQAYIENNGVAAWVEKDGTLVVMGSMQCPYYVHKAMQGLFPRREDKIRVIQTTTGGGFGGKEEYPNMIAGHAALLSIKSGRPVKIIYDRHEDMLATTKRHPARVRHRTGVRKDGTLLAQDIEIVMDGGAYVTLSPVVLSRGALHASGPYECPNVRILAKSVATNNPPSGAFRGFGAPQTLFAAELHMEKIAAVLGIDSLALRRRNLFREGSVTATGQILKESVGAFKVLERTVARSQYSKKRAAHDRWNRQRHRPTWRGMGLAVVFHGAGFTGAGEVRLASRAGVALTKDGEIHVEAASTEIGQGTSSMFAQIVAETLGVPYEWIRTDTPDTGRVPDSGPTVASRTCMVVGGLLQRAALRLKTAVEELQDNFPRTERGLKEAAKKLTKGKPAVHFVEQYAKPEEIAWDEDHYKGDAYGVYSYAALAIDLEIDKLTYEVRIRGLTTAQDIGKAINPLLVEGQIIGGTAQALGYALLENAVFRNGVMQNAQFTNYIIPTTLDTPPMRVELVEEPYSRGPFGAKGVGELPFDVPAPAVAAAVFHATGLFIPQLPLLPERIARTKRDQTAR
ncbi:MAG TPA: xanthine dehydrogenase family protein molybdopterin-binding subunit [Vicinamibacteria bacterium]|jgi:CO/xanthine dehydrogenase Mo-binding subunit